MIEKVIYKKGKLQEKRALIWYTNYLPDALKWLDCMRYLKRRYATGPVGRKIAKQALKEERARIKVLIAEERQRRRRNAEEKGRSVRREPT